jgi:NIMA (never in mitosis gene a)-related kinase
MEGFEILKKLGDGAYSVVYKVRRKADGNIYALKKVKLQNLSEKEKENALNEVRILASIKSTFVISYKEAFIEDSDSSLCLVMEYADNGDLYQKIVQFKKMNCLMDEVDVWRIFIQMTKGLKALHDLKILHRDLKSANIFLESNGTAKIGDLNVSKVAKKGLGYTQTGTPYYASPEVWKDQPYDLKSDIWSLGCVTYEMVTLHPPFRAQNMEGLYNKVIKGNYPKINDKYSNDLSELIKLLLKVNSAERPNCGQILKHPIVKKRIDFFQATAGMENEDLDNMDEAELLKTIRIPKNILFLSNNLPDSNYDEDKKNSKNTFPNKNLPNIKKESNKSLDQKDKNNINKIPSDNNIKVNVSQPSYKNNEKISKEKNGNKDNNQNNNKKIIHHKEFHNLETDINQIPSNRKNNNQNNRNREYQKYIEGLGLSEIYKIYSPSLDIGVKKSKKNYANYIPGMYNQKKSSNVHSNNYRIIPNKRLNPIKKKDYSGL